MEESKRKNRISVEDAARRMGVSKEYVRMGLIQNRLPFGTAVRKSTIWSYHISPKLFEAYIGNKIYDRELPEISLFTKIELLKYIRQFIENKKLEISKLFFIQLMKYTGNQDSFKELDELLNFLNKEDKIYTQVVLLKIDDLLNKSEEELSQYFNQQDNPSETIHN